MRPLPSRERATQDSSQTQPGEGSIAAGRQNGGLRLRLVRLPDCAQPPHPSLFVQTLSCPLPQGERAMTFRPTTPPSQFDSPQSIAAVPATRRIGCALSPSRERATQDSSQTQPGEGSIAAGGQNGGLRFSLRGCAQPPHPSLFVQTLSCPLPQGKRAMTFRPASPRSRLQPRRQRGASDAPSPLAGEGNARLVANATG
jgi:hypothetical protein